MEKIKSLEVTYEDGRRELFQAATSGTLSIAHTCTPPGGPGMPTYALSFVTATMVIPTPPRVAEELKKSGVKLDPRHD
jgi:hypothetical protein